MRFILDTDKLKEREIGISGCLFLLASYLGETIIEDATYKKLSSRGLIFTEGFENGKPVSYTPTQDGANLASQIITECTTLKASKEPISDRFIQLAEKIRDLYPKGKKPGTSYQWRDSVELIATRLKTLILKYNVEFTDEEAIQATKNYIQSFNGDYRFMMLLKYFIFKNTNDGVCINQNSQLLSNIAEIRDGEGDTSNTSWTSELR